MKGEREKERGKSEEGMNGKESKLCLNSLAYQACKLLFYIDGRSPACDFCLFVCLFFTCFFVLFLFASGYQQLLGKQPASCMHSHNSSTR